LTKRTCPRCGKPLQKWYSACGGKEFIGCSDIRCGYKEEIN